LPAGAGKFHYHLTPAAEFEHGSDDTRVSLFGSKAKPFGKSGLSRK
jgi:hypothetical protein